MKTIAGLKSEIEQIKQELSNQNIDLQEMKADNAALIEMSEHRDYELTRLKNELANVYEKNRKLKEEKNAFDEQVCYFFLFFIIFSSQNNYNNKKIIILNISQVARAQRGEKPNDWEYQLLEREVRYFNTEEPRI